MCKNRMVLIICEALLPEIEDIVPSYITIKPQEFGLHNYPQKLNDNFKDIIKKLDEENCWDYILLGYGYCSHGVVGLNSRRSTIIIPKAEDCIEILLGSHLRYINELKQTPGTYYLSKGWVKYGQTPLSVYRGEHEWTKRYDAEKREWAARELIKNYSRLALIDTGRYEIDRYREYGKETSDFFSLQYEELSGCPTLLDQLISGNWPPDDFLIIEPGATVVMKDILPS